MDAILIRGFPFIIDKPTFKFMMWKILKQNYIENKKNQLSTNSDDIVDGRNPAPPGMYKTLWRLMEGFDNHEFFSVIYQVFKQNQFMQPGFCFVDCTTFFGEKLHIMVNVVVFFCVVNAHGSFDSFHLKNKPAVVSSSL